MRLFLFALLFLGTSQAFGQACTEATINAPDGDGTPNSYTCTTLTVGGLGINRAADGSTDPLIITVSGNVTISADINLDGGSGNPDLGPFSNGGLGGPGASPGGGFDGASSEPGGVGAATAADGQVAPDDNPCASGGGGAGFATAGESGTNCATSVFPNNGGTDASAIFQFTLGSFRGGFGGAAGGLNTATNSPGAGGGGGGAILIDAGGTITIDSGVTISAIGGTGGNDTDGDGGGGGGSGGAVWLIGDLGITNNGTINVSGADGGTSSSGGDGGTGRAGRYRLESAGQVTEGSGIRNPDSGGGTTSSSSSKLTSDISCGTISKKSDFQNLYSIALGFALIPLLINIRKSRKLFFS